MEDHQIVQLYWDRDSQAIAASAQKYGTYCRTIARNILPNDQDAEECVNDTWLSAWNAMPPHKPSVLSTFLGKLTRNLAFNRYKHDRAEKRGGGETALVLDELAEIVSGTGSPEEALDRRELARAIDGFLKALPAQQRKLFLCRYWYSDSVRCIASRFGLTENHVSVILKRIRTKLRSYLTERGFDL